MSRVPRARPATRGAAALALLAALGCQGLDGASPADDPSVPKAPAAIAAEGEPGSLTFDLQLQNGARFDAFNYVVTGPGFTKAGSLDVSASSTVSTTVGNLPAGAGYAVTLTGASVEPDKVQCSGSAPFDISPGVVTSVLVSIACHVEEAQPQVAAVPIPPVFLGLLGAGLLAIGLSQARRAARATRVA